MSVSTSSSVARVASAIARLSRWAPDERAKLLGVEGPGWYAGPVAIAHTKACPCSHDDPGVLCFTAPILLQGGPVVAWWIHARWLERPPAQQIDLFSDVWVPLSMALASPVPAAFVD